MPFRPMFIGFRRNRRLFGEENRSLKALTAVRRILPSWRAHLLGAHVTKAMS